MVEILLANREQRCAERFSTYLQTGYGGLSFAIRVYGAIQSRLTPVFRAVGHRKGSKQLLNTSAGLVRTVIRNELIVHGAVPSSGSQRTDDHSEFFRTIISSS